MQSEVLDPFVSVESVGGHTEVDSCEAAEHSAVVVLRLAVVFHQLRKLFHGCWEVGDERRLVCQHVHGAVARRRGNPYRDR
jgi:hypothetical protein